MNAAGGEIFITVGIMAGCALYLVVFIQPDTGIYLHGRQGTKRGILGIIGSNKGFCNNKRYRMGS